MGKTGMFLYKVLGMASSVVGGVVAGAVFKRVWKLVAHEEKPPEPTDEDRRWREVIPAAALRGAVAGGVRATIERGGAVGVRRATGSWPD